MCIYAWARYHAVVTLAHAQLNPFYHPFYPDIPHVRKDTRPSPAFPYCKQRKAGWGLGTRLYSPCADILALHIQSIKIISENPCSTQLEENSRFSMSPLPRLHSHDTITIVELLHHARTKSFCHISTQTKKKRTEKFHSLALALALTLTVTLRPDHSATRHC